MPPLLPAGRRGGCSPDGAAEFPGHRWSEVCGRPYVGWLNVYSPTDKRIGVAMTSRTRAITVVLLAACLFTGGLAAIARSADANTAVSPAMAAKTTQGPNLLLNPDGSAGATSAHGWDAVTIPGWQVQAGLPAVVRYGTAGFPKSTGIWPASRGDLFAGGAGGTASLVQVVRRCASLTLRAMSLPRRLSAPSAGPPNLSWPIGASAARSPAARRRPRSP
jgi:hypothetical protein